jgi:ATP phosphoribosyltransferase
MEENKLKIAIQKSGRLYESSVKLIKECGLSIENGHNKLKAPIKNFPAEVLMLRDDDIPQYVSDGIADIGIVGENVVAEKKRHVLVKEKLGFASCRLSIAVPKSEKYTGVDYLSNKKIATSYPNILQGFLDDNGISSEIHEINGSVEIAPGIGLADAICDIVSSGSTLFSNGLKEVEQVLSSEAVLIARDDLPEAKSSILDQLIFRLRSVRNARNNKYILLNAPDDSIEKIRSVIPGMKSPTIMPLANKGWSSLHSVVNEDDFWDKIDQLQNLGAEGILVIPIEKMII